VRSARWVDDVSGYELETSTGRAGPFDLVVSCVGMLSDPAVPEWANSEVFQGPIFHTARYRHDIGLTGRRVALVGTGSTACQLAPRLAEVVGHLDVYQREPGYVLPKKAREISEQEQAWFCRVPLTQKLVRWNLLYRGNRAARAFRTTHPEQARIRDFHGSYLERKVVDPVVRRALTPTYAYGCKRPVFTSEFYSIFNRQNVTLVPQAVSRLTARGLIAADGTEREADAVILATGFRAAEYLSTLDVVGRNGRRLREVWRGEPWAFLGMTVPGFPNFFMVYGPNTNGGWSICGQLERQSGVVARVAQRMVAGGLASFDTRPGIASRYDRWVQGSIQRRRDSNQAGCHNYFHAASGKNVTQWPYSAYLYGMLARGLPPLGLVYSRRRDKGRRRYQVPSLKVGVSSSSSSIRDSR
jgi:cation diffusion facilitator CzcD-associated flavoprotein CzcO